MLGAIAKIKARTVFSFIIYVTWCVAIIINMFTGKVIPETLHAVVMAQLAFYYGGRTAKKSEVK